MGAPAPHWVLEAPRPRGRFLLLAQQLGLGPSCCRAGRGPGVVTHLDPDGRILHGLLWALRVVQGLLQVLVCLAPVLCPSWPLVQRCGSWGMCLLGRLGVLAEERVNPCLRQLVLLGPQDRPTLRCCSAARGRARARRRLHQAPEQEAAEPPPTGTPAGQKTSPVPHPASHHGGGRRAGAGSGVPAPAVAFVSLPLHPPSLHGRGKRRVAARTCCPGEKEEYKSSASAAPGLCGWESGSPQGTKFSSSTLHPWWGITKPYVVEEQQEPLNQLQTNGAGNRAGCVLMHLEEQPEGHPEHLWVYILQELTEPWHQELHSFHLCGTQHCAVKPGKDALPELLWHFDPTVLLRAQKPKACCRGLGR